MDRGGFGLDETGTDAWRTLWGRGGFPRAQHPGDEGYVLDDRISVLPVAEIGTLATGITPKGW